MAGARPGRGALGSREDCAGPARSVTVASTERQGFNVQGMASVFVFGSNLGGRHGKGAALHARRHYGAVYGQGVGRQGRSYAIPTKDAALVPLPLEVIARHVADFLAYARERPATRFWVTAVGCGLAGFSPRQIGPLFRDAPANCELPPEFARYVKGDA